MRNVYMLRRLWAGIVVGLVLGSATVAVASGGSPSVSSSPTAPSTLEGPSGYGAPSERAVEPSTRRPTSGTCQMTSDTIVCSGTLVRVP